MLKAAIEKIVELASPSVIQVNGKTFSNERFTEVKEQLYYPECLILNSLDGIVKMIQKEAKEKRLSDINVPADDNTVEQRLYVRVSEYNRVDVFTSYDTQGVRTFLYRSNADVPGFREGFRDRETMLIQLRSLFLQTQDVAYLLDLLSKMSDEEKVTSQDNGVTQVVEARKGVALKEQVEVRPRVKLTPFRTFLEVDQPESEFLLRVGDGGQVGLFEADGGVWKLVAKRSIAAYLEGRLKDLVEAGRVVIMM